MRDWRAYVREHLPALSVGPERENEIVAEVALQMEQAYTDALSGGASPVEARARAERQVPVWDDLAREINLAERNRASRPFNGLAGDARYALRHLLRNRTFAAIAILTLAFGIGANVAVFSLVDALVLRGVPYRQAAGLVAVDTRRAQQPEIEPWTSPPDFFDLRERTRTFSALAAIDPLWNLVLTGRGEAEQLQALFTSAELFPMLGVKAAVGRTYSAREDVRNAPTNVTVLSYSFWQRRFGGRREILGQSLIMDGSAYTVVGVMPPDFRYVGEPLAGTASEIDVYCPLASNPLTTAGRAVRCLKVVGRLRSGVSTAQAGDDVRRVGNELAEQYAASNRGYAMDAQPLATQVTGKLRLTMVLMLGAVGFVLAMACANVAGLLLARAAMRAREISVRVAIGASRFRLVRQMLTEGVVLAAIGGAVGLVVAHYGLKVLVEWAPASLVQGREIALNGRALLFAILTVLGCAVMAGLPGTWRMMRDDPAGGLREGGRGLTGGRHNLRSALVTAQVAVAFVLAVGAGLLIHSFQRLMDIDPGFQARNLLTIATQVPPGVRTPEQKTAFYGRVKEQLESAPGVRAVAAVSRLPMQGMNLGSALFIEGKSTPGEQGPDVEYRVVTNNFFAAMGVPLREGRWFDDGDDANAGSVLVINEVMAHRFWPAESAVGKRVKLGPSPEKLPWLTVIGVVGNVRHFGLDADPRPEVYRPYAANPLAAPILVVRTAGDPAPMGSTLAERVRSTSSDAPAYNVMPMQALVDRSTVQRRFAMYLFSVFSLAALLLSGVGIYGTVSQTVTERTQEIGLRMALGASPASALSLVFRQGTAPVVAGLGLGTVAAVALTGLMRNMLFEVRPLDPVAFAGSALALALFAGLACYVPARRATRVDPLEALRR